jgi:tRNA pseudouridine55 synthase
MKVYNVYKSLSRTPLEALESLRIKLKIHDKQKLTYAGRLDPMAEGVLVVLQNSTQVQKDKFLKLSKVYEAEVLLGFSSDSFDALGLAKKGKIKFLNKELVGQTLKRYIGKVNLVLPAYSSPLLKGKPLHMWARGGGLSDADIPLRQMHINKIENLKFKKYKREDLLINIENRISRVNGDFRQKKIIEKWKVLLKRKSENYTVVKFTVECGSGTYIRSIANDLGKNLKVGSLLFGLKRLSVGRYKLSDSLKMR